MFELRPEGRAGVERGDDGEEVCSTWRRPRGGRSGRGREWLETKMQGRAGVLVWLWAVASEHSLRLQIYSRGSGSSLEDL